MLPISLFQNYVRDCGVFNIICCHVEVIAAHVRCVCVGSLSRLQDSFVFSAIRPFFNLPDLYSELENYE
jgi:hypothetical protein